MHILITYDIANTKRRTKVATLLEGYGVRVNYSVFELDIAKRQIAPLLQQIEGLADTKDSVRIYSFNQDTIRDSFELLEGRKPFSKESGYVE